MNKPDPNSGGAFDPGAFQQGDVSNYGGENADAMMAGMAGMFGAFAIVWLAVIAFMIFLYWKIFSKAGFSGWLSLLLLVPIANFIVIIWFAFADWPVRRHLQGQAPGQTPIVS